MVVCSSITHNNNTPGVTITETDNSTEVTEGGATDTYTVVLDSEPSEEVTINFTHDDQVSLTDNEGNPIQSLTFDSSNWNVAQTVMVTAVDDAVVEGNHTSTITHTVETYDYDYENIPITNVTVNINDANPGIIITESGGSTYIVEDGVTDTYTVKLSTEPTADVTISIEVVDVPDQQSITNRTELTFTPSNGDNPWDTPQSVTITAVNDEQEEGVHNSTITHIASSEDDNYDGLRTDLTATVSDLDLEISTLDAFIEVAEGQDTSLIFTVTLSEAVSEEITFKYLTLDGTALSNSDFSLTEETFTFAPGDTEGEIEIEIFGEAAIDHNNLFEIFAKDISYRDWKIGQDVSQIGSNFPYGDLGYRVDEFWDDQETDFQAVGLIALRAGVFTKTEKQHSLLYEY